jgi:sugar lactone lactonase YvrE
MRPLADASLLLPLFAVTVCLSLPARAHPGHEGDGSAPAVRPPDALAVTQLVHTGTGSDSYVTVPNWCQIPAERNGVLGATHGGIVIDKAGEIIFSMDGGPAGLMVYSPEGKFLRAVGDKSLTVIHGLCLREEGGEEFIYAAQLGRAAQPGRALKLKLDGTVVWEIPYEKFKESGKYTDPKQLAPTGIAVGPDGSVYVADGYGQNWVHVFDKDQKYVKSFGGPGKEPGKFQTCHGIALDTRGPKPLLLVCDRANRRLQHFDLDGNFVAVITEGLRLPCSVSFHGDHVAVAELEGRVAIIDGKNKLVSVLGDNPAVDQRANYNVPPDQWKPGVFTAPHGVCYDKDQNLYVMDWNSSGRVSRLNLSKQSGQQAKAE